MINIVPLIISSAVSAIALNCVREWICNRYFPEDSLRAVHTHPDYGEPVSPFITGVEVEARVDGTVDVARGDHLVYSNEAKALVKSPQPTYLVALDSNTADGTQVQTVQVGTASSAPADVKE